MKILLSYATYSSGTFYASQKVADELQACGHAVTMKEISETNPSEYKGYDLIVFGSPSWWNEEKDGQPHQDFLDYIGKNSGPVTNTSLFAVFGLGDSSYSHFCGAVDVLEDYISKIHGTLIIPSLKIDGYLLDQAKAESEIHEWVASLHLKLSSEA